MKKWFLPVLGGLQCLGSGLAFSAELDPCPVGSELLLSCRATPVAERARGQDDVWIAGLFDRARICWSPSTDRLSLQVGEQDDEHSSPEMPLTYEIRGNASSGPGFEEVFTVPTRLGGLRLNVFGVYARLHFLVSGAEFEHTYRSLECERNEQVEWGQTQAWETRLRQAEYWNMHWTLDARVAGGPLVCGEIDPFKIGDACLVPVRVERVRRGFGAWASAEEAGVAALTYVFIDVTHLPSEGNLPEGYRLSLSALPLSSKRFPKARWYADPLL